MKLFGFIASLHEVATANAAPTFATSKWPRTARSPMNKGLLILLPLLFSSVAFAVPKLPTNCVFKPTFLLETESFFGGTAFVAQGESGSPPYLVTCHHLFGPATGQEQQMSADDIAQNIVGAAAVSLSNPTVSFIARPYVKVPNARVFDDAGCDKDLALFLVPPERAGEPVLTFASSPAKVGDRVWLCARLRGTPALSLYPATVSFVSTKEIDYVFDSNELELRATSGAPVLDAAGRVVTVNLGGGPTKGRLIGIGNPVAAFRSLVSGEKAPK